MKLRILHIFVDRAEGRPTTPTITLEKMDADERPYLFREGDVIEVKDGKIITHRKESL